MNLKQHKIKLELLAYDQYCLLLLTLYITLHALKD